LLGHDRPATGVNSTRRDKGRYRAELATPTDVEDSTYGSQFYSKVRMETLLGTDSPPC